MTVRHHRFRSRRAMSPLCTEQCCLVVTMSSPANLTFLVVWLGVAWLCTGRHVTATQLPPHVGVVGWKLGA